MNLTHKFLRGLEVGDVVEFGTLLPGLDEDEPIAWELIDKSASTYLFALSWHTVSICSAEVTVKNGLVKVRDLP